MTYTIEEYKSLTKILKKGFVRYFLYTALNKEIPEKTFKEEFRGFLTPETYDVLYGSFNSIPLHMFSTHRTVRSICRWRLQIGH